MTVTPTTTAARFLAAPAGRPIDVPPNLHGFGGLHGGLALARLTAAMAEHAPGSELRAATGHFHRPLRDRVTVTVRPRHRGSSVTTIAADAVATTGEVPLSATAMFGCTDHACPTVGSPTPPSGAAQPEAWDVFEIPTAFVPVASTTEIRPVGPNRPYAGGDRAELTAWVRIADDDTPPDALRLIFLLDALAPSYAAILRDAHLVPTVELSVRLQSNARPSSPWVLLHACTVAAHGGWIDERIDAWDLDGSHLASASQLRVVRSADTKGKLT